jgi:hypothetical protein
VLQQHKVMMDTLKYLTYLDFQVRIYEIHLLLTIVIG